MMQAQRGNAGVVNARAFQLCGLRNFPQPLKVTIAFCKQVNIAASQPGIH